MAYLRRVLDADLNVTVEDAYSMMHAAVRRSNGVMDNDFTRMMYMATWLLFHNGLAQRAIERMMTIASQDVAPLLVVMDIHSFAHKIRQLLKDTPKPEHGNTPAIWNQLRWAASCLLRCDKSRAIDSLLTHCRRILYVQPAHVPVQDFNLHLFQYIQRKEAFPDEMAAVLNFQTLLSVNNVPIIDNVLRAIVARMHDLKTAHPRHSGLEHIHKAGLATWSHWRTRFDQHSALHTLLLLLQAQTLAGLVSPRPLPHPWMLYGPSMNQCTENLAYRTSSFENMVTRQRFVDVRGLPMLELAVFSKETFDGRGLGRGFEHFFLHAAVILLPPFPDPLDGSTAVWLCHTKLSDREIDTLLQKRWLAIDYQHHTSLRARWFPQGSQFEADYLTPGPVYPLTLNGLQKWKTARLYRGTGKHERDAAAEEDGEEEEEEGQAESIEQKQEPLAAPLPLPIHPPSVTVEHSTFTVSLANFQDGQPQVLQTPPPSRRVFDAPGAPKKQRLVFEPATPEPPRTPPFVYKEPVCPPAPHKLASYFTTTPARDLACGVPLDQWA